MASSHLQVKMNVLYKFISMYVPHQTWSPRPDFYSDDLIFDKNASCMGHLLWLELFYFFVVQDAWLLHSFCEGFSHA
jgi:hypothetical protein